MEMVLRIFLARCLLGYFHHQQEENKSPLLRLMRLHGSKPVHLQILFYTHCFNQQQEQLLVDKSVGDGCERKQELV